MKKIVICVNLFECPKLGIVKAKFLIGYPDTDEILYDKALMFESKQDFFDHIKKRYFIDRFKWEKPEISEKWNLFAMQGVDLKPSSERNKEVPE